LVVKEKLKIYTHNKSKNFVS